MKKLIATVLILLMAVSLCACNSGNSKKRPAATGSDLSWEQIEKLADERLAQQEK